MSAESEVAYARGSQTFMGLTLAVDKDVLVPREETELLARTAIARLADRTAPRIIDVCCGAGNLACALAKHLPAATVFATDLTDACVALTRRNVVAHGLAIDVRQGDLLAPFAELGATFDAIVCNPPYISTGKLEARTDLADEPRTAFDGGPYGLSLHQRVIREAAPLLVDGGLLFFEFGVGQGRQLELLFQRSRLWQNIELVANADGEPRVAIAQK